MHHLTCGISSHLHSHKLILFSIHSSPGSPNPAHITSSQSLFSHSLSVTPWPSRVGIVGGGVEPHTVHVYTDAHFWVKIGFKFQYLGKISNISAADPPPSSFRSIPTALAFNSRLETQLILFSIVFCFLLDSVHGFWTCTGLTAHWLLFILIYSRGLAIGLLYFLFLVSLRVLY